MPEDKMESEINLWIPRALKYLLKQEDKDELVAPE